MPAGLLILHNTRIVAVLERHAAAFIHAHGRVAALSTATRKIISKGKKRQSPPLGRLEMREERENTEFRTLFTPVSKVGRRREVLAAVEEAVGAAGILVEAARGHDVVAVAVHHGVLCC